MNNQQKIKTICPICSKQNTWHPENAFRPFCSSRCKLIDLGEWASEDRKIPSVPEDPEFSSTADDGSKDSEDYFV